MSHDRSTHHDPDYFSQAQESESIAPEAQILSDGGNRDYGRTYDGQSESKSRRRVLNQENWIKSLVAGLRIVITAPTPIDQMCHGLPYMETF